MAGAQQAKREVVQKGMEIGFGCIAVFVAIVLVFAMTMLFMKARRGARREPGHAPARGAWSCASCGAVNPERVHPCPHCGHAHS